MHRHPREGGEPRDEDLAKNTHAFLSRLLKKEEKMNDCLKELGEFLARLGDVAAEHIYLTIFGTLSCSLS